MIFLPIKSYILDKGILKDNIHLYNIERTIYETDNLYDEL